MTTLTALQDATFMRILQLQPPGPRASGARYARSRRSILRQYRTAVTVLGFTAEQIDEHVRQIMELVKLEQVADYRRNEEGER